MDRYEKHIARLVTVGLDIDEHILLGSRLSGLYIRKKGQKPIICINPALSNREKICVIAEEAGHHYRTFGNVISLETVRERKGERDGRIWAYMNLLPLEDIAQAWLDGINTIWDLVEHLEVTERFLMDAIDFYHQRFGEIKELHNDVIVQFDPYFDVFKAYE